MISFKRLDAQCSETDLQNAIDKIKIEIDSMQASIDATSTSQKLIRKMIDCKANVWGRRDDLYDHYEGLCQRRIIVRQVYEDLGIKKKILEKENMRCAERSKYTVLTPKWNWVLVY